MQLHIFSFTFGIQKICLWPMVPKVKTYEGLSYPPYLPEVRKNGTDKLSLGIVTDK